jgi:hypothetical protein
MNRENTPRTIGSELLCVTHQGHVPNFVKAGASLFNKHLKQERFQARAWAALAKIG